MISGSTKLTKQQYQSMRIMADTFWRILPSERRSSQTHGVTQEELHMCKEPPVSLPHYFTLAETISKIFFGHLTVRAVDAEEYIDVRKTGARPKRYLEDGTPQTPVRTVLPSEFACADIATKQVYDLMSSASLMHFVSEGEELDCTEIPVDEFMDALLVVYARAFFFGCTKHVSVDFDIHDRDDISSKSAERGDTISFTLLGDNTLCESISNSFAPNTTHERYASMSGVIVAVWPISHSSRKGSVGYEPEIDSELSLRDETIFRLFHCIDYQSPSDDTTVEIPTVRSEENGSYIDEYDPQETMTARGKRRRVSLATQQAMKARKDAVKKRKELIEKAWMSWQKPIFKLRDVVCLVRPCPDQAGDTDARVLLVHRFWVEREEQRRHAVWLPRSVMLQDRVSAPYDSVIRKCFQPFSSRELDITCDVISCRLQENHSGPRGPDKYRPVSSVGRLGNGERYFIYRFMLYWDGFEICRGSSGSGDGLYLICLNLPTRARSSSNSVRIVSLFERIEKDIVQGMTEGF